MDASGNQQSDEGRTWIRSRSCASSGCVEIAMTADGVLLRDSKDLSHPPLDFDREEWIAFVNGVKAGQFDLT